MTIRLMRVCASVMYYEYYFSFADKLDALPFSEAMDACRAQGLCYPGGMKAELEQRGFEVMDVLIDVPKLQLKWLRENGRRADVFDMTATFFEQLKSFRPHVVYLQTLFALSHEARRAIKTLCPSVRIVCGHRGFPHHDVAQFADLDAVFLGYPRFHDHWTEIGVKPYFHLHCFDQHLLPKIRQKAAELPRIDFSYIGTTGWGSVGHEERYRDLRRMMANTNLVVHGFEVPVPRPPKSWWRSLLRYYLRALILAVLQNLPERMLLRLTSIRNNSQVPNCPVRTLALMRAALRETVLGRLQAWPEKRLVALSRLWFLPPLPGLARAGLRWQRSGPDWLVVPSPAPVLKARLAARADKILLLVRRAGEVALRWKRYGADFRPMEKPKKPPWYARAPKISELYPDRLRPPQFGVDYLALLASSRITWNRHQSAEGAGANMRVFEAGGANACQLVDALPEVTSLYTPDKEIVVYRNLDECVEKARWLIDHPAECAQIAQAAFERTMREHTVSNRVEELARHLSELLRAGV